MDVSAHGQRHQQQRHRAPAVASGIGAAHPRVCGRAAQGGEACELGDGDREAWDGEQPDAGEPELRRDQSREQRARGDAQVAAHREDRHGGRAPLARQPGGVLARFRMEGRDAEAADQHADDGHGEGVREGQRTDAETGDGRACDKQPLAAPRVEDMTEDRLHDGRCDRRGEHDRRGARVREVQLAAQERQQRGHAALREVRDHVTAGEQPERAQRPAQSRRGDGGSGHTSTVSWPPCRCRRLGSTPRSSRSTTRPRRSTSMPPQRSDCAWSRPECTASCCRGRPASSICTRPSSARRCSRP